ncbi:MAG: 2-dehydropantoate 2-reductase [Steroidobacteraceae bacterium]
MRILVLGAGGTGGYFGGRLVQAGCDVTFLVRPARAARLRSEGLVIRSPLGDARLEVAVVESGALTADYDLVLLSCKAYDLEDAIASIAPAMNRRDVTLLPLLNGLAHFDTLDAAFGASQVLGGLCHISATLNSAGEVEHLNRLQSLTFGERDPSAQSDRCERFAAAFGRATFDSRNSSNVLADLWEKFAFMSAGASLTCLMRASVGKIVSSAEGERVALQLIEECAAIARAAGYPPSEKGAGFARHMLASKDSAFKASMLRDIEAGQRVEADHLVGDMARRGRALGSSVDLLEIALAHLRAYELSRAADSRS